MLANISVGHDANINIVEALQMFSVAWKTLNASTIVNCFHKARIVPQDKCKSETESESDADMVNNWQHLCQKLDVEVALDDFHWCE
jgi:hypothetical protein